jgi:putative ABC transport system substrate-binding protein
LIRALSDRGWVEGKNLILERRSAEGHFDRFESILRELVSLKCDLIVTTGTAMAQVARKVTSTAPILMTAVSDADRRGVVSSLARPGGNMTGITDTGPGIEGKRIELLKQALPTATRVVVVRGSFPTETYRKSQENAAAAHSVTLLRAEFGPGDEKSLFALMTRERPDAVYVGGNLFAIAKRHVIIDFTTRNRIPSMATDRSFPESGGLMSYAPSLVEFNQIMGDYADRILRGAKPGDLPIQRPSKLELVVNLKTAKAIGVTLPEAFLLRADDIIR